MKFRPGDIIKLKNDYGPIVIIHIDNGIIHGISTSFQRLTFYDTAAEHVDLFGISEEFLKKWDKKSVNLARLLFL